MLEDHRGFHVAPVSKAKLLDITFMRKELESKALVLGIRNADEQWEARVLAAYHALARRSVPDRNGAMDPEWESRHGAFHFALVSGCQFRTAVCGSGASCSTSGTGTGALSIKFDKEHRDFMREHRELMEAALERDADAATYLMNRHITMSTRVLLAADPALFG